MKAYTPKEMGEKIGVARKALANYPAFQPKENILETDFKENPDEVKSYTMQSAKLISSKAEPEAQVAAFIAIAKEVSPEVPIKLRMCYAVPRINEKLLEVFKDNPLYNYFEVLYNEKIKFTFYDGRKKDAVLGDWAYVEVE